VDATPPTISGVAPTSPNANGWYKGPVTGRFTASDTVGLASVTDQTLGGEGANQSVTGTAMGHAGNSARATVSGINVDLTAPTISGATAAPNASGWYNGEVTVHWTAADATSGVASAPADSTVAGGQRPADRGRVHQGVPGHARGALRYQDARAEDS
jgi:hypothetical protein